MFLVGSPFLRVLIFALQSGYSCSHSNYRDIEDSNNTLKDWGLSHVLRNDQTCLRYIFARELN